MAVANYTLTFTPTPGSFGTLIEVREQGDTVWTTPSTSPNPTLFSSYTLVLDNTLNYDVRVSANGGNCTKKYRYIQILNDDESFVWVADDITCETEGGYEVVKTITGLSSPVATWFDTISGMMYVADLDDTTGNVYWFDPATATTIGDMIYSTALVQGNLTNGIFDPLYRRIYFVGNNSNGLIVYDIDTDSISTVAFGSNGSFFRTLLEIFDDKIYCNDASTSIIIIDRASLTITLTKSIASIPTPAHFNTGPYTITEVGSELWVVSNNADLATVGVYSQDLSTLIDDITLPGALVYSFGNYWQTIFYDSTTNKVYVGDTGSSKRFVIDGTSRTILNTQTAQDKQGKSFVSHNWFVDPVTNNFYTTYSATNSSADGSPIVRIYPEDRTTYAYSNMFVGQFYRDLVVVDGTDQLVGCSTGLLQASGVPGWQTDGSITVVDSSSGATSTGRVLILTLKEQQLPGYIDTGDTKPNVITDDDYLPPYDDLTECPIAFSTTCPEVIGTGLSTSIVFELTTENRARLNPALGFIKVKAMLVGVEQGSVTFPLPDTDNYFSGTITGLASSTSYNIEVDYLSPTSVLVANCPGLLTVSTI
jgi:hypothetical protein